MMIVLKYKIRFILFSFIFTSIFFLGCTRNQTSSFNASSTSKDYFLVYRGADHNGFLNSPVEVLLKYFFKDRYGLFKMNYTVLPPIEMSYNQDLQLFQKQIIDVASRLEEGSTFIIYLSAHGAPFAATATHDSLESPFLEPHHIVEALKEGLSKNSSLNNGTRFRRFILWMDSCYSGQFVNKFKEFDEIKNGTWFNEGIYIKSSDATLSTMEFLGDSLAFFLLRNLQIQRCNSKNNFETDYRSAYKTMEKFFTESKQLGLDYLQSRFAKCFSPDIQDNILTLFKDHPELKFDDTPKFKDFDTILALFNQCLEKNYTGTSLGRNEKFGSDTYSKYIVYSNEDIKYKSEIFPEICPSNNQ